jgi:hypothetical protein
MKNISKYFLFALLTVIGACNEVTDLSPVNVVSEDAAFSSEANVELSLKGVYDAAQSGFYGGSEANTRGYVFGAAHIQQGDMRGEDMVNINAFYGITYETTYDATTANNVNFWANAYRLINVANLFIEGAQGAADKGIVTSEKASALQAEARMLRAMAYYELVINFARPYRDGNGQNPGVPIRLAGVNSSSEVDALTTTDVARNTVAEVYDQIITDLDFAEANLSADNGLTRASKGAAIAYKTRIYLHKGEWDKVITEAQKMVPATGPFESPVGNYALTATVDGMFYPNDRNNSESIFSIEQGPNDNATVNGGLANMLGSPIKNARGEVAISPILWNETFWHADDLRRSAALVLPKSNSDASRLYTNKYREYSTFTDYAPIIRYAEVLLNYAEAEARKNGVTPLAIDLLNAVRDRAKAGTMTSYSAANFATGTDLVRAIINETRIEFVAEGHRWATITRTIADSDFSIGGIPAKMRSADITAASYAIGTEPSPKQLPAYPYSNYKFVWPIPADELVNNPAIADEQNPQY